tara:strand:- start:5072 stop:5302 length:231 start_codon:yes stop_codon:yes gene_type:complete
MRIFFNDRPVELELSGWGDNGDDITIESAIYLDDSSEVSDEDINVISDHFAEEIHTEQYINMASRAYDDWKNAYDR